MGRCAGARLSWDRGKMSRDNFPSLRPPPQRRPRPGSNGWTMALARGVLDRPVCRCWADLERVPARRRRVQKVARRAAFPS